MSVVEKDVVALISYTLTNGAGETLDVAYDHSPLAVLQGAGNVVSGLEEALEGLAPGDEFDVTCPPEKAFGVKSGPGPQGVKRSEFRRDVELRPGMSFRAQGSDGTMTNLWITEVKGSWVYVDSNHPLADETLTFKGKVVSIRPAFQEEIDHGHPHGIDGHQGH